MLNRSSSGSRLFLIVFLAFLLSGCELSNCPTIMEESLSRLKPAYDQGCWWLLPTGDPVELTFKEPAQITYGTSTDVGDSFFFIAQEGDRLASVTGATIRTISHVERKFGSLEDLLRYEIDLHNARNACLRDANHENRALTEFCASK